MRLLAEHARILFGVALYPAVRDQAAERLLAVHVRPPAHHRWPSDSRFMMVAASVVSLPGASFIAGARK
jgi:hypothetical protein